MTAAVSPRLRMAEPPAPRLAGAIGTVVDPAAGRAPLKLIYIAGYGRSGTTLIDIALGGHPAIFGGGELSPLTRHAWANGEHCACGRPVPACPLWSGIVADWQAGEAPTLIRDYARRQRRSEDIVGLHRWLSGRRDRDHARLTAKLLRGIAAASGCGTIVDSSKLPGRGVALAHLPGVEALVVHVVRDARAVVWSLMKPHPRQLERGVQRALRPKPLLYTAARWTMVNLAAEALRRQVGPERSLRVRYEDFVADPAAVLDRITGMAGLPPIAGDDLNRLVPQHQVAGSRHRMQPELRIAADTRWREEMPPARRRLVEIACRPLLRRYGYLSDASGAAS